MNSYESLAKVWSKLHRAWARQLRLMAKAFYAGDVKIAAELFQELLTAMEEK